MTRAEEQGFEIARRYLHGSDIEKAAILSCFTEEEQKNFMSFIGYFKLFNDKKYYNAVKGAVVSQCLKDIYG